MLFTASIIIKEQALQTEQEAEQPHVTQNKAEEGLAVGGEAALV